MNKKHDWDNEWIRANFCSYPSTKSLFDAYSAIHGSKMSYDTFKWHCREVLGLRRGEPFQMSDEQRRFIKDGYTRMPAERLRKAFNERFGTNIISTTFYYYCNKLGLSKWNSHTYTDEQENFLSENAPHMMRRELTQVFNRTFGTSVREDAIVMHCWQRGYGALNNGRFAADRKMTVFIDGNASNFSEENTKDVSLRTFATMHNNGWLNGDKDITKAGLLWCELFDVMENNLTEVAL